MKILVLGGYGTFGGRLIELLSDVAELEMLVGGRNLDKATAFCEAFEGETSVRPLKVDRNDIAGVLDAEKPDLVVDASGPFQAYGNSPYQVVEQCISARVNYLDFADSADFVFGISRFDEAAKEELAGLTANKIAAIVIAPSVGA